MKPSLYPAPNPTPESIPIVFVHQRYSFYLEFTLRQARLTNPDSPLHLIGDAENNRFPFVQHTPISALTEADYDRFGEIYSHASPNHIAYELFCFRRWFLLRELMQRHQYPMAFVADTDVMLYDRVARTANHVTRRNYLAAYNIGADCDWVHSASGHSSYWTTEGIEQFCRFLLDLYGDPASQSLLANIRAQKHLITAKYGISDMTALYLFLKRQPKRILNLSPSRSNRAFDHNVGTATNYNHHEYRLKRGQKRIIWVDRTTPVCYNQLRQQPVRMATLHFQGSTKNRIHRHYTGRDLRLLRLYRESRLRVAQVYQRVLTLQRRVEQRLGEPVWQPNLRKLI